MATLAVAIGVVLLVFIGFAASYATLRDLAVSDGRFSPWLAPVVPLSFDLGIVVLSLKVVLAAKDGRSAIWLRLLVAGLSAATVAANASAAPTLIGRLLHAIPPAMFVICFESVTGSARRDAPRVRGANLTVPPVRPLLLLLLAPMATCMDWRQQVLAAHRQRPVAEVAVGGRKLVQTNERSGSSATASALGNGVTTVRRDAVAGRRAGDDVAEQRLRRAREELRANPDLTAAALAEVLRASGHTCSVRTSQRVKAQALMALASADTEASAEAAA